MFSPDSVSWWCVVSHSHINTHSCFLSHTTHTDNPFQMQVLYWVVYLCPIDLYICNKIFIYYSHGCVYCTHTFILTSFILQLVCEKNHSVGYTCPLLERLQNIQEKYVDCKDANLYGGSIARLDQIHCLHLLKCRCIDGCIDVCKMKMKNENVCLIFHSAERANQFWWKNKRIILLNSWKLMN